MTTARMIGIAMRLTIVPMVVRKVGYVRVRFWGYIGEEVAVSATKVGV